MLNFVLGRVLTAIPVMAVVAVIVFLLIYLAPGDPAAVVAGETATAEMIASLREAMGANDNIFVRFWAWLSPLLHGDLGNSIHWGDPVIQLLAQRAGPTISLSIVTIILSVGIAVVTGVMSAARVNTLFDRTLVGFTVAAFSLPTFVVGYLMMYFFSIQFRWLPVQGYAPLSDGFWPWLSHLILPAATLGTVYIALIARVTRAAMLEILNEDYIRTARAKGVPGNIILYKHALKNAGVPIATIVGNGLALLISGVVITETVFNLPGVGRLVVDAIARRDYPIIQGVTLIFAGIYVLLNLLVDLSYTIFDPRIRR